MGSQDSFFVADASLKETEDPPLLKLAAWHRVGLCVTFIALMVAYLGWLLEG